MRNTSATGYGKPIVWLVGAALLIGGGLYAVLMLMGNSQQTTAVSEPAASVQVSGSTAPSRTKTTATLDADTQTKTQDQISLVERNQESEKSGGDIAAPEEQIQVEEPAKLSTEEQLLEEQVDSFLADVKEASKRINGYDLGDLPPDVARKLVESPEFASRLLNHYTAIGDGAEKSTLHNLFVDVGAMSGSTMISDIVASRVGTDSEDAEAPWYQLMADLGVRTPEARGKLFDVLPNLAQGKNVSAVIQAIAPEVSTPEIRRSVLNELSPYLNHPDPQVRSAAIHTVSNWGSNDQASVLERALTDTSKDVRHAAAGAALTSNVQSDAIKTTLLSIMNSGDEHMSTRVQAHYALTRYSLADDEYGQFHDFHEMLSTQQPNQDTASAANEG